MTYEPTRYCAAGRDCLRYDPTGGPDGLGGGAETARTLCDGCLDHAAQAVKALPYDWHDLEQQLPPAMGQWGDGTPSAHSDAEAPVPMNLAAEALQAAIWRLTTTWEEVARDVGRLPDPPSRRRAPDRTVWAVNIDGDIIGLRRNARVEHPSMTHVGMRPGPSDVVRACRILHPRLAMLADVPELELVDYPLAALVGSVDRGDREPHERWGAVIRRGRVTIATVPGWQGVLDLAAVHRRARGLLGLTSRTKRLPGNCPACGWPELCQEAPRRKDDDPLVRCTGCDLSMAYDAYEREARGWMTTTARRSA